MSFEARPLLELADDLDGVHGRVSRVGATLGGLSVLFGGLTALTALGGAFTREPLFLMSAGFSLTASAAFALCAQSLRQAASQTPRIRTVMATLPVRTWRREG